MLHSCSCSLKYHPSRKSNISQSESSFPVQHIGRSDDKIDGFVRQYKQYREFVTLIIKLHGPPSTAKIGERNKKISQCTESIVRNCPCYRSATGGLREAQSRSPTPELRKCPSPWARSNNSCGFPMGRGNPPKGG